ncbi:MAG: AAA family ATPase [Gammaproteobacteria bacterium]|nr:AAA family ATPase [Gammaproteobacteria bacterium]
MILTSVHAHNFLKYRSLELDDLPEKGVLAISGENESGKSSIGETICFALFGRTFSLSDEEIHKAILWGENECAVTITFKLKDGDSKHYELARFLDSSGNHSARLGEVGAGDAPFARGIDAVHSTLHNMLGFEIEEFMETFYLAQREITSPHGHSEVVKNMAGISLLESVDDDFRQEIAEVEQEIEKTQARMDEVVQQQQELALDSALLAKLEESQQSFTAALEEVETKSASLTEETDSYHEMMTKLLIARDKCSGIRMWMFLIAMVVLAAGACWWLLTEQPQNPFSLWLQGVVAQQLPALPLAKLLSGFLVTAVVGAVIYLLLLTRLWSWGGQVKQLEPKGAGLAELLHALADNELLVEKIAFSTESSSELQTEPEGSDPEAESGEITADETEEAASVISLDTPRPEKERTQNIARRTEMAAASSREVKHLAEEWLGWFRQKQQLLSSRLATVNGEVEDETRRVNENASLDEVISSLQEVIHNFEERIGERMLGCEIISGAITHFSHLFNRTIRELVGNTLPRFTQGRYEHLQIEPDLTVAVFSSEKRGFMALDEISSGTQRQIMLALRIAMAQTLVIRVNRGRQFLFLDEPFAFFDAERTRTSLAVLPELSDSLSQVWIVAQSFPEGSTFSREVRCDRGVEALT